METIEIRGRSRCWQEAVLEGRRGILPASFRLLCRVLATVYSMALSLRQWLYRQKVLPMHRLDAKVISVGNITLGGTGKTPTAELLAGHLRQRGKTVAILTRGHGRMAKGLKILKGGDDRWQEVGDEPLLLSRSLPDVPIVVGSDRVAGAELARKRFRASTIILDDGFQYLRLNRDVNIVVIDATCPWGNGRLFPAGILREPLRALRRAHLFVLNRVDQASDVKKLIELLAEINPGAAVVQAKYRPRALRDLASGRERPLESLRDQPVLALSGIGNPASLELTIQQMGARLIGSMRFPDHHVYRSGDVDQVVQRAVQRGATVLTTEKDATRLPAMSPWPMPILCLAVEMVLQSGADALWELVERGV